MNTPKTEKVRLPYYCPTCRIRSAEERCICGRVALYAPHELENDIAYTFRDQHITARMMKHIRAYIDDGVIERGDFLEAVVCNDLAGALGKADPENYPNIHAFVTYFYNEAPSQCWGSQEKMDEWIELGGANGKAELRKDINEAGEVKEYEDGEGGE